MEDPHYSTPLRNLGKRALKGFLSELLRNSLSRIFTNFEQGFKGANTLQQFFMQYTKALKLTPAQQKALKNNNMKVKFLDYNWDLNARQ